MNKKILIFSTAYFPFVGGAEVAVKEITDRLDHDHFEMITARLDRRLPTIEKIGNIIVHRVGFGLPFDKFWLMFFGHRLAERLWREGKVEVIWSIMASYAGFTASSFKSRNMEVPYLLTLQEGDELGEIEHKVKFIYKRWQKIFVQADYVQSISVFLGQWAKTLGSQCPIEVIPNGVDLEKINNPKEQFCPKNGEKIIITTSRLVKKNGVGDLIKALALLDSNFKLWVLGTGPEESALKELTTSLGLDKRVTFYGLVENSKVPDFLAKADIFARPSLSEGLGNSFLEAMGAGLPVIATPVGGIPDFLVDGETGWFCEVANPKDLAEKIRYVADPVNVQRVETVRVQARQMVEKTYDWDKITGDMEKIFEKLYEKI